MKSEFHFPQGSVIGSGLDPTLFPRERLLRWLGQPRIPVFASEDPLVALFVQGMFTGEKITFVYVGGSMPGAPRTINVSLVFRHETERGIYVAGYCHSRGANRIFRMNLAMVIQRA